MIITTTDMATIYEFNAASFDREEVSVMDKQACEDAFSANAWSAGCVRRFEDSIENVLNNDYLNTHDCWYRVFND